MVQLDMLFIWHVQSIWQGGMDGSDINAVDRSHSSHLVAVGMIAVMSVCTGIHVLVRTTKC